VFRFLSSTINSVEEITMGQAKRRGSYDERVKQSIARQDRESKERYAAHQAREDAKPVEQRVHEMSVQSRTASMMALAVALGSFGGGTPYGMRPRRRAR
jgi:hypothetical protein